MTPNFKVIAAGVNITPQIRDRLLRLTITDEAGVSSTPATLTIRAKGADLGGDIKDQKSRSWDKMTIGDIVATIASDHGLTPKVAEQFVAIMIEHIDQTDESDIAFLDRLGRDHDALVSVKGGALLFMGKGQGRTVSGLPIPPRPVLEGDTTSWTLTLTTREAYKSVTARRQ